MKNKTKSVLAARRNRYGYVFIVPWIIGFLLFFLLPLGQSIYYSFCKVSPSDAGFSFDFIRLENYRYLFEQDTTYKQNLWESVKSFLYSLPLTVILSLVLAVILNQKFRGGCSPGRSFPPCHHSHRRGAGNLQYRRHGGTSPRRQQQLHYGRD